MRIIIIEQRREIMKHQITLNYFLENKSTHQIKKETIRNLESNKISNKLYKNTGPPKEIIKKKKNSNSNKIS